MRQKFPSALRKKMAWSFSPDKISFIMRFNEWNCRALNFFSFFKLLWFHWFAFIARETFIVKNNGKIEKNARKKIGILLGIFCCCDFCLHIYWVFWEISSLQTIFCGTQEFVKRNFKWKDDWIKSISLEYINY